MAYTKYHKWHDAIIARARGRTLDGYSERHHVVPKCLGGQNTKENYVRLTAEEHFVVHQLLVRMYPTHSGLAFAALQLGSNANGGLQTRKTYGWLRRAHAEARSKAQTGVKLSAEFGRRVSEGKKGRPNGRLGLVHTQETKDKIRAAHLKRHRPEAFCGV